MLHVKYTLHVKNMLHVKFSKKLNEIPHTKKFTKCEQKCEQKCEKYITYKL